MSIPSPTAIFVAAILLYISSFVLFAIIRISTGISIQRIGYFSLRHIAYSPKEGVHISIRGLGFSLHRPSFAQPTYLSLRFNELTVTLDPKALGNAHNGRGVENTDFDTNAVPEGGVTYEESHQQQPDPPDRKLRGKTWKVLTNVKERVKRLHGKIKWLALVDITASNSTVRVRDGCDLHVGELNMAVDTRRKAMQSGKLFRHKKDPSGNQQPAEWILNARNVLLALDGCEHKEIVDNLGLNIHGLLQEDVEGLRDVSVAIKVGRLHVPYDDVRTLLDKVKGQSVLADEDSKTGVMDDDVTLGGIVEEPESYDSEQGVQTQKISESKEFFGSFLRGIQEIQLALSFFRVSCTLHEAPKTKKPLYLNFVTHEVGLDFHRMDPAHPAHRMYFQREDVAHQALLAAISSSFSLDENIDDHDKILYVPMATTTIKTTLPSKTVATLESHDAAERNTNLVFANFVITSPSVDLEPRHLSQILALVEAKRYTARKSTQSKHLMVSRLLPKCAIKLSVHEPILRFVLPVSDGSKQEDYNLLVSSISSISLDLESSHSAEEGVQYSLASIYRVASHQLYYQTTSGARHRLLATESMEVKVYFRATNEYSVAISGFLNAFSIHLITGEVTRGIHQVVEQFQSHMPTRKTSPITSDSRSFLRRVPSWLRQFQFETSGFSIEVAGTDEMVGTTTRGVVLQLGGWSADYQFQKSVPYTRSMRRRTPSHSATSDDPSFRFTPTSPAGKSYSRPEDGRRLAIHVRGLEGFIIESADFMELDSFLSIPRFELAFSTSSDLQGPVFNIASLLHEIYLKHSLYRYYAIGIAASVMKNAFYLPSPLPSQSSPRHTSPPLLVPGSSNSKAETVTFDIRIPSIQLRCEMPLDPSMLLQISGFSAGRHRWATPFIRAQAIRLHAESPDLKGIWARVVSVTGIRMGLRESQTKQAESLNDAKSFEISTDFIRLAVPHHMVMHRIFDNFVNSFKAIEQLNYRFKTGSDEYVREKPPVGPKHVPRICLRSKSFVFELEDDTFEWKLSCIYRLGLQEQKQRLAREEAFQMKMKKVDECLQRNATSGLRNQSAHAATQRSRVRSINRDGKRRSASAGNTKRTRSTSRGRTASRRPRYDPVDVPNFSDGSNIPTGAAWLKLQAHNAQCWKAKIDSSIRFQNAALDEIRSLFSGADEISDGKEEGESILPLPSRPGLLAVRISDFNLTLDAPSFPMSDYPQYLNRIGKGMPLSMKYSLLIPMSIHLELGEARANLRDYPLDLVHIPALGPGQSRRLPSWSAKTDFVIAEEYRDYESSRCVSVNIIPPGTSPEGTAHPGFSLDVRRTVSSVKTYSNPTVEINTNLPTTISWGMSYQPVIQDMMKIIENFTKPAIDPSERVGFWDKIRLSVHSRINVIWKEDGDVHLQLKGSRDPYVVTGFGAGFVMCWRKDVQLELHSTDDPKELMAVTSGEYVLAVPDYSHQARHSYESPAFDNDATSVREDEKDVALFKKVIMKLSGNVRWLVGLVFERNADSPDRCFTFNPHYDVVLRNPKYLDRERLKDYDAFNGFRSNHIHLSLAIVAPVSREWSVSNRKPSTSYNIVHLSPRFFTHFFNWWSLFSGVMSLPIRQGKLWPGLTKTSKKFSRHLGTIKYNLFLSPLFAAHIYKHKDVEDYSENTVFATGLKVRLDSFMLDLHQRREQACPLVKGRSKQTKTSMMRINRAQLDFIAADFRAVSSSIGGTNPSDLKGADDIFSAFQRPVSPVDMSRFTIPDDDLNWIDMDDFVELDWILPAESNPRTLILPLAYSPRFSYFRQTDHKEVGPDEPGYSPFGDEPTHFCVMSQDNDPRRVQMELIKERLQTLEAQITSHERIAGEHELQCIRDGMTDEASQSQSDLYAKQGDSLKQRQRFLQDELQHLEIRLSDKSSTNGSGNYSAGDNVFGKSVPSDSVEDGKDEPDNSRSFEKDEFTSDFDNRFIIHNIQLKWNNSLRNIILRYIHQVSQRRGFVYYMSRRAVKFILDIVEEQGKSKLRPMDRAKRRSFSLRNSETGGADKEDEASVQDRIEQLLNDAKRFVNADESGTCEDDRTPQPTEGTDNISAEFTPQNSYHLKLIAPQIQLQSEKNKKSVVLVTAKGMQLKVISIMDKRRVSDDVSGLVQRRFTLDMDSAQFFLATQKGFSSHVHIYCGNRYGNAPGSAWPPWVSLESMSDFDLDLSGFSRIIQKTSASLRYDKYNTLRLKYNEKVRSGEDGTARCPVANENRMDQIFVEFPQVRAICDSAQYYSMYIIVLDLLLYSEPLEQIRSERLEKIMLASDFSDLRGAPEMVNQLQQRIRHLEEIKGLFQIQAKYLDKQGWADRMALEKDLATCEDELFFIMKAITTSQRRADDRTMSYSSGLLRWTIAASEIVWHLMTETREPLAEFQLRNAAYERTDNIDGSNNDTIEVQDIYGINLLPNALYPQVITPYLDDQRPSPQKDDVKMLKVKWHMLEAIGGIPVLDNFEVTLFPLKIQLERELGQKLFEYVFPGVGSNAFENGGFSPFIIKQVDPSDDDSEAEAGSETHTPAASIASIPSISPDDASTSSHLNTVEQRLKPTLSLPDRQRSKSPARSNNILAMTPIHNESLDNKRRTAGERGRSPAGHLLRKKGSVDSLRFIKRQPSDRSLASQSGIGPEDKNKKFALPRQPTRLQTKTTDATDDISQMVSRASNYMILTNVKINDVVLCLSYKGKGERNIEDIHDFVFRLPVLDYRNKTWSNLDLALRLKKDAIKALISHAPAILGNKFSHHRPTKQQQKRFRDLATSSQVLSVADGQFNYNISPSDGSNSIISRPSTDRSDSPNFSLHSHDFPASRARSIGPTSDSAPSINLPSDARSTVSNNREDSQNLLHSSFGRRTATSHGPLYTEGAQDNPSQRQRRKQITILGRKILGSFD